MDRVIFLTCALVAVLSVPSHARAESPWQAAIAEASERFGIPETWIRAVIKTESGGTVRAISPKGAMGLMQLMPGTWNDLREAHHLGPDPFDPKANIMAGTAYLKAMYDRFGYPALFLAYNAGPERYEAFLTTGRPLPEETRSYAASLEKSLARTPEKPLSVASEVAFGRGLFFPLADENPTTPKALFVRLSGQKEAAP